MSLNPKNLKEENKMLHSPATWVPTLYFAMGMPFVVLNMVCTLMYKGSMMREVQKAICPSDTPIPLYINVQTILSTTKGIPMAK